MVLVPRIKKSEEEILPEETELTLLPYGVVRKENIN